jgi:uncharacterized membrane protein YjgN (DUF898 family)
MQNPAPYGANPQAGYGMPQQQHNPYGAPPQGMQPQPGYGQQAYGQQAGGPGGYGAPVPGHNPMGPMGGQPMGPQGGPGHGPLSPPGSPMGMQGYGAPMAPAMGGGAGIRPNFQGSGGELFVTFLVGYLLTLVTIGIYAPWFYCKVANFVLSNTTLGPTRRGELRLEFTGMGGELFVTFLVGYLLTLITTGIYAPWFMAKLTKFFADNTVATAADGTRFRPSFEASGGELFVTFLVGYLLTAITIGIYMPWFLCKVQKTFYSRTMILENEQQVGSLDFEGKGGELFVTYLVGYLLTLVTIGIYAPWFVVKLWRFFADGTRVLYQGRTFAGSFHGTGGELFVTFLVGYLLTAITIGIYAPWFMIKMWQFQINNREFSEIPSAGLGPAFPGQHPMQAMPGMR